MARRMFGDAGLGKTEESHLAMLDQIAHCAGHVLDGHGRIDAVLVQQVDMNQCQAGARTLHRLADMRGPAVSFSADLLSVLDTKAELWSRSPTWSRRPLNARPSSSSLVNGP